MSGIHEPNIQSVVITEKGDVLIHYYVGQTVLVPHSRVDDRYDHGKHTRELDIEVNIPADMPVTDKQLAEIERRVGNLDYSGYNESICDVIEEVTGLRIKDYQDE